MNFPSNVDLKIPEKGCITGEVGLSPVQKWFFERDLKNIHYFNQSAMFEVNGDISISIVRAIFNVIAQYHDIFRIKYEKIDGKYYQYYTDNSLIDVSERDLRDLRVENFSAELQNNITMIQSGLHIFNGPLARVVLYHCVDGDKLLLVIHHLIIDGVSWRIIRDDIETIYKGFLKFGKVALPIKSYSYRQWVKALMDYVKTNKVFEEIEYWENIEKSLQELCIEADSRDLKRSNGCVNIKLTEEETSKLLYEAPKTYESQINDILITALTLAAGDASGNYEFSFVLEGHGREDVIGIDVTRTVGWFTSIFPVFSKITNPKDLFLSVSESKNTLQLIPNKGIGYGIIRYFLGRLNKPLPKISFNYLGQWDAGVSSGGLLRYAKCGSGRDCDEENISCNLIDINCCVKSNVFDMWISYKGDYYSFVTISKFADLFRTRLVEIINCKRS
jgi:non-ribosomal peptide synthase protein (TIGR01720 family)